MPTMHFGHGEASDQIDALVEAGNTVTPFSADDSGVWVYVVPAKARKAKATEVETR